ncbi:putative leucine-rich repeat receptor-like protein kinase [Ananas comosus]|uniref:non-specific serine/threonine protein kinase n=1 Tax=Ananas comosus TaxID=4615 RepID=A0A199V2Y9_ANACO|nr:putative leucine-rich repeat receptor-like protein kinase [Ananas comosus]
MGNDISKRLQIVSFRNNALNSVMLSTNYNNTLILSGNPVCSKSDLEDTTYCKTQQETSVPSSPNNKSCSHPYEGAMIFRAPSFGIVTNSSIQLLEKNLSAKLECAPNGFTLENCFFNNDGYLEVKLIICPSDGKYFNRSEILDCFKILSSQDFVPPDIFGPYYFTANIYLFEEEGLQNKNSLFYMIFIKGCIVFFALVYFSSVGDNKRDVINKTFPRVILLEPIDDYLCPFSASWASTGEDNVSAPTLRAPKCFTYDELKECTNGFRGTNEIGVGGYGKVYKGRLLNGQIVAIKRRKQGSEQGRPEFKNELELLSQVHHKNLVGLVGFCCEKGEQMIVYEFMCNGTIEESLSGKRDQQLDWNRRLIIALDSATGLAYLHRHASPAIIHGDVKSSNILLDENLSAKVADFGISKSVPNSVTNYFTYIDKGTPGYLAPEAMQQQITMKSDVYSFGVVMLELITAKPAICNYGYLVERVKNTLDKQVTEYCGLKDLLDPVLLETENLIGFERFLDLALQCTEISPDNRPTMSDVAKEIETILKSNGMMEIASTSESSAAAGLGSPRACNPSDDLYSSSGSYASSSRAFECSSTLSNNIGKLDQLQTLDLSYNQNLGGLLTPAIGNVTKLNMLSLISCSFIGTIPDELGNLGQLTSLSLNSNQFTGRIPASLGKLSNLNWLDLADNQLSGPLPTSTNGAPGLDQLLKAQHFHLNKNQLSGSIPENLFNANLTVQHVLLDRNQLTGGIPESVGLVRTLEILNLGNNDLSGQMPNLTAMRKLKYVDLSNNSFDPSESPSWFLDLKSLTTLIIESGGLHGQMPQELFGVSQLEKVALDNNEFNGTLDMGNNISRQLQIVSFKNNALNSVMLSSNYNNTLILSGNPVCSNPNLENTPYCHTRQETLAPNSSNNISCSHPYEGAMIFRAPSFGIITNSSIQLLEKNLSAKLECAPNGFTLENPFFNNDGYLEVKLIICPSDGQYFNRSEILDCFDFNSQDYVPPNMFGPYYFYANLYSFQTKVIIGLVTGMIVGLSLLLVGLLMLLAYALRQKRRAQRAISQTNPFASWLSIGEESVGAPTLRAPKCFTYDELKECTNGFQGTNEIGVGGYGKVYKGMLPDGQTVAIKRRKQGSRQGGPEFKTELELLSRVHHKNLVELVGFCCEKGELVLVYEFMCNGTIEESLSGKRDLQLDWSRRLMIALDSATGLAYLHDHANPPIIHRDVKSSNVLLDENLIAKVADFGLSHLVPNSETDYFTTNIKGTIGYLAPEAYMLQQITRKSDVYSFGVVMLELITAKPATHNYKNIVDIVKNAVDRHDTEYCGLKDLIDPVLLETGNLIGFKSFLDLALRCVEVSADDRPTMSDVAKEIEIILKNNGIMKVASTSESSSATDLGSRRARNPYDDLYSSSGSNVSRGAFEYSSEFSFRSSSRLSGNGSFFKFSGFTRHCLKINYVQ